MQCFRIWLYHTAAAAVHVPPPCPCRLHASVYQDNVGLPLPGD